MCRIRDSTESPLGGGNGGFRGWPPRRRGGGRPRSGLETGEGFPLTDYFDIICVYGKTICAYNRRLPCGSCEELSDYYEVLKQIAHQAKEMELENEKEVLIACKKQFSRALEYSSLWN